MENSLKFLPPTALDPKIPTVLFEFFINDTRKSIGISLCEGTLYSQVPFVIKAPLILVKSYKTSSVV